MELKNNVRVLIVKQGFRSLQEFAEHHKISYYMLRKLANNETNTVDINLLVKLCEIFDCSVNDLIYIEKEVG